MTMAWVHRQNNERKGILKSCNQMKIILIYLKEDKGKSILFTAEIKWRLQMWNTQGPILLMRFNLTDMYCLFILIIWKNKRYVAVFAKLVKSWK